MSETQTTAPTWRAIELPVTHVVEKGAASIFLFDKSGACVATFASNMAAVEAETMMNAYADRPALIAERDRLRARVAALEEALTPSGATKAAYIGEVSMPFVEMTEDGEEYTRKIAVDWTATKEIMAMIVARASLGEGK